MVAVQLALYTTWWPFIQLALYTMRIAVSNRATSTTNSLTVCRSVERSRAAISQRTARCGRNDGHPRRSSNERRVNTLGPRTNPKRRAAVRATLVLCKVYIAFVISSVSACHQGGGQMTKDGVHSGGACRAAGARV
jgi:hypothetical protein